MDRLRPHQLLHPELVTEGMNRLAQALICLTDPVARAVYDAELDLVGRTRSVSDGVELTTAPPHYPTTPQLQTVLPYEVIPGFPIPTDDETEPVAANATPTAEVPFEPGLLPPESIPPPYEVVAPYEIVEGEVLPRSPPYEVVAELVAPPPAPPWQPATRRELYARLADLRRFLAAWQKLKPFWGDPREPLDRPIRVLALLEAVSRLRLLVGLRSELVGAPGRPGAVVVALVRQPLVLHTFRTLLPDQRRALALDWRRAELELIREHERLREASRSGRPRHHRLRPRGRLRRLLRWVARTPETILWILVLIVVIAVVLRSSGRS
jgi:hypothetical protein